MTVQGSRDLCKSTPSGIILVKASPSIAASASSAARYSATARFCRCFSVQSSSSGALPVEYRLATNSSMLDALLIAERSSMNLRSFEICTLLGLSARRGDPLALSRSDWNSMRAFSASSGSTSPCSAALQAIIARRA